MLCRELLWWGPGDYQSQLDEAYRAFKAYCLARKISHSQPAFTVKLDPWPVSFDTLFNMVVHKNALSYLSWDGGFGILVG